MLYFIVLNFLIEAVQFLLMKISLLCVFNVMVIISKKINVFVIVSFNLVNISPLSIILNSSLTEYYSFPNGVNFGEIINTV